MFGLYYCKQEYWILGMFRAGFEYLACLDLVLDTLNECLDQLSNTFMNQYFIINKLIYGILDRLNHIQSVKYYLVLLIFMDFMSFGGFFDILTNFMMKL